MKYIELTVEDYNSKMTLRKYAIYINIDKIIAIEDAPRGSFLRLVYGEQIMVLEKPKEILEKITASTAQAQRR